MPRIYLLALLAFTGCTVPGPSFLNPAGPVAAEDRHLLLWVILLMLIVVVPAIVLTPLFAWRYRLTNKQSPYRPKWSFSWSLEVLIWGAPVIIVAVLGVSLWSETHRLDPYRPIPSEKPALRVQVVGFDWKWLFIYPEQHIATVNELVFPADRPVHLSLTSDTVMQSFMIPRLGGQIYAMAGMRTELNLKSDAPGSFVGENTQFNGDGFQKQRFQALALPPQGFSLWVSQIRSTGTPLDAAAYAKLSRRSVPPAPIAFSAVEPNLFEHIIDRYRDSPAPMPARGTGGAND